MPNQSLLNDRNDNPSEDEARDRERELSEAREKKNGLIRAKLILLLHVEYCRTPLPSGDMRDCEIEQCAILKEVFTHMMTCTIRQNCPVAHCSVSKQILGHWRMCRDSWCPICPPLRLIHEKKPLFRDRVKLAKVNPNYTLWDSEE